MRSKTSATLLLLVTFLLGGITGAIAHYLYRSHVAAQDSQRTYRPQGRHDVVEEMARGLNLDEAQKEKLRAIFADTRAKYQALERQFRPQYQAIHAEADEAIQNILNDEQKKRFEQIVREEESRRRPRSPRGPK
jgi:Spy/CpxP family protein refolding chaperone